MFCAAKRWNVVSHGELAIQSVRETDFFAWWVKKRFFLFVEKIGRKWTAFVLDIRSRLVHISATEGLNKSKSINQAPGQMPR